MPAKIVFDLFGMLIQIFNEWHPEKEVEIHWVQRMKIDEDAWGRTEFPDDEAQPIIITLDADCPTAGLVEVLAHELAHVMAGLTHDDESGHGKRWKNAFARIHEEYLRRVDIYNRMANPEDPFQNLAGGGDEPSDSTGG